MRQMVVKLEVMVYDGVVHMVCSEEMFERAWSLVRLCFDGVHLNGRNINFLHWFPWGNQPVD